MPKLCYNIIQAATLRLIELRDGNAASLLSDLVNSL